MPSDAFTPSTSIIPPLMRGLPRTYRSERDAAGQTTLPLRGTALGKLFGPTYQNHVILDAELVPRGGRTLQVITHCEPADWFILKGSRNIPELNASAVYHEQIVPTPEDAELTADPNVTFTPLDEVKSLKRTEVVPTAALAAYYVAYASRANIPLPDTLQSVSIVWQESGGNGSYTTDISGAMVGPLPHHLSANDDGSAHGSAGAIPELDVRIRRNDGSNTPTTSHFFFLPLPVTEADIITVLKAKLAVASIASWPRFKPESASIVLRGVKVAARATARGALSYSKRDDGAESYSKDIGEGTDYDFSNSINTVTIPPTIHGTIPVSGTSSKTPAVNVTADVGWTGWGTFPSLSASSNASTIGSASVTPTSIGTTSPAAIPTSGIYLLDTKVEPFNWGYARVFAETINAAVFA